MGTTQSILLWLPADSRNRRRDYSNLTVVRKTGRERDAPFFGFWRFAGALPESIFDFTLGFQIPTLTELNSKAHFALYPLNWL